MTLAECETVVCYNVISVTLQQQQQESRK